MANKKTLIFGITGQDGSLMAYSLLKKGYEIIGVTRDVNKSLNFKKLGISDSVKLQQINGARKKYFQELIEKHKPDKIYNFAAQSSVGISYQKPYETIDSSLNFTIDLLEACKAIEYNGKIFNAGSSEMYGSSTTPATLESNCHSISPYAIGKESVFKFVKMYRDIYKLNCMTGILFNHESPLRPETFITQKIIYGAIKSLKNNNHILEVGNTNIYRDWGWAEDYVEGIQLMTQQKEIKDQIICTGKAISLKEFITITFKKLGLDWQNHIKINKKFIRPFDIYYSVGDPTKMNLDTKWKAKYKVDQVIDKLIECAQINQDQ